jgi:hypothetical protein
MTASLQRKRAGHTYFPCWRSMPVRVHTMCAQSRQTYLSLLTPVRLVCLALLLAWPLVSSAEEFPSRAIKLVVPFPAGGPADTFGRVLADRMGPSSARAW